ncbi:unnamed protein product [Adineta ricciae]|uniref:Nuclear receptor domain-containing protein n=1 Tax=Adineta ricciae TaxID=249248 RepID=A0A815KP64_ADIRI|nr:unnamed protein product [Adineta ricciae]CAF1632702.1 unnamed protein product [Adineta ricciae]
MNRKNKNCLSSKSNDCISTYRYKCQICDEAAEHSNYGAICCSACKIFFRRNAMKQFQCDWNNNCEISINTRRVCSACRLKKCLANRMDIGLIRSSLSKSKQAKQKKTKIVQSPILTSNVLIPTSNLLQSDESNFSIDQWNSISNLIHCYDEYGPFLMTQQYVSEQTQLPTKIRYKSSSINKFYVLVYMKIQQIFEKNDDYQSLCSQDRASLTHRAVKHASGYAAAVVIKQMKLYDDPLFFKISELLFNSHVMTSARSLNSYVDEDLTFNKLIVAALFFSTTYVTIFDSSPIENFIDIRRIIRIQDQYIELAWKYMVYKHDYRQSVLRFIQLLRSISYCQRAFFEADHTRGYESIVGSLLHQTEETFVILHD